MTNDEIYRIAMEQSAIDLNCHPGDFLKNEHVVVISEKHPEARKYLTLPFECQLVSYGNNIVASVDARMVSSVDAYIHRYSMEHCLSTPNLYMLNEALRKVKEFEEKEVRACFMAEYFLPDMRVFQVKHCGYETRVLTGGDFSDLYVPEWSNALCEMRKELDVLGVGAYDGGKLIGLAGCSADCDTMWQVGIDVLPAYRKKGVAVALTTRLAMEIMERGKVPFYCAAWSNIRSVRNAISCGFRPAWVELTARRGEVIRMITGDDRRAME